MQDNIRCREARRPVVTLWLVCIMSANVACTGIEQAADYRMELYDAPVPARLDGAGTVNAVDVKQLQESVGAVVIDVIPQQRRPQVLPENQIWIPAKHLGIPGAIWLPDTGYGVLSKITERYFRHRLELATGGDRDHPVIFYCRADCWMSWNAAKRALSYGYTNVFWFDDGIDGWILEDFEVQALTPAEGRRQSADPQE